MTMITKQFPARLSKDIAESENFQRALMRLKHGKPATPRSWVYENEDPQWILDTWSKALLKLAEEKDLSEIAEWDLSKSDKFESQGEVAPFAERQKTLSEYWKHLAPIKTFNTPMWKGAIDKTVRDLGFNQTGRPLPVDEVIQRGIREDKYNTSSGDPLFLKRKNPAAIEQARTAVLNGTWEIYFPVLAARASMGKIGAEARWIFMFPMSVNLQEQRFQQPLQDYIRTKHVEFFTPWEGYEHVQDKLSNYCTRIALKFGCDYSKMDQHFNLSHATQVYEVIKHYFQPQYWAELYRSIRYTFECPVVAPDHLILGPHSMPSGSGWTNFLETMFNLILLNYLKKVYHLPVEFAMGIGDDQLWLLNTNEPSDKLTEFIVDQFNLFGLEANPSKQEVSTYMASFLQRRSYAFWSPHGIKYAGVYPTIRALTSEIYPEFYHNEKEWNKKTFALRCLMILENCKNHPLFEEFCIFIAKGNKNITDFAKLPDAEILLTRHSAKKIANFIPTYNQEKAVADPVTFESLRIIRNWLKR